MADPSVAPQIDEHPRITAADRDVQAPARAFHRGAEPPRVRHFIHERIPEDG